MIRGAAWQMLLLLPATACTADILVLPWPELGDGHAGVIALESSVEDGPPRLEWAVAFDPSEVKAEARWPIDLSVLFSGDAKVTIVEYAEALRLEDLGLAPGRMMAGEGPSVFDHAPAVQSLALDAGTPDAWRRSAAAPTVGPLAEFRFDALRLRCACLLGRPYATQTSTAHPSAVIRLGHERVVVGTSDGKIYWVRRDGVEDFTPTVGYPINPRANLGRSMGGGVAISADRFVLTDYLGRFFLIELDELDQIANIRQVATWPTPIRVRWLKYEPPWIYGLDVASRFGRVSLDTGEAQTIHAFEVLGPNITLGGVSSSGPEGEVVVASARSSSLGRYRNGEFRLDSNLGPAESLTTVRFHESLGLFAGATRGLVLHQAGDGAWSSCNTQLASSVGAIEPFADGFIAGATQGFIEQYSARDGWCPKLQAAFSSVRHFVPFDDEGQSFVATGPPLDESGTEPSVVSFIDTREASACDEIRNPGQEPLPTCRF